MALRPSPRQPRVTRFKIEGLRELERALADLPRSTGRGVLRRVLKKAAEPIAADAEANAPRNTGALSREVTVASRLTRHQARMQRRMGKSEMEMHIGVRRTAGVQNEFGNANQPAQPFMRPAWDANKDSALRTIADDLGSEIEKAAARQARKTARLAKKGS